jgi:hypothetical protein
MSASRVFGDELDARGIWWPRGDGDALRELALAWKVTADVVEDITAMLDQSALSTIENYHGAAADRFAGHWRAWSGDHGYLANTVTDIRRLVASLTDFGTDIDIADRTLARLVEQAIDETHRIPTPSNTNVWMTWLHDCATAIRSNLDAAATRCGDGLSPIAEAQPPRVGDVPLATIHAAEITWPEMGVPVDLSAITTSVVDFGAGQGRLPVELDPTAAAPPITPAIPAPVIPPPTTVVIIGDGNTVTVTPPSTPTLPPLSPLPPLPTTPLPTLPPTLPGPTPVPPVVPTPDAVPVAVKKPPFGHEPEKLVDVPLPTDRRTSTAAEGLGSGGAGGGGFGGGISLPSFEPFVPEPLPPLAPLDLTSPPLPAPASPVPAAAPIVAATGAATAAVAAAGKKASNNGFFPMMPMAGGGSGDESPEPKRRSARRPRPPIV